MPKKERRALRLGLQFTRSPADPRSRPPSYAHDALTTIGKSPCLTVKPPGSLHSRTNEGSVPPGTTLFEVRSGPHARRHRIRRTVIVLLASRRSLTACREPSKVRLATTRPVLWILPRVSRTVQPNKDGLTRSKDCRPTSPTAISETIVARLLVDARSPELDSGVLRSNVRLTPGRLGPKFPHEAVSNVQR